MDETFDPEHLDGLFRRFDYANELRLQKEEHRGSMCRTLLSFIEVRDSLERFLEAAVGESQRDSVHLDEWLSALRAIALQFDQALEENGVKHLACLNSPVEPGIHRVVDAVVAPGLEEGIITREVLRGYEWDSEVLRKPSVIVARGERQSEKER